MCEIMRKNIPTRHVESYLPALRVLRDDEHSQIPIPQAQQRKHTTSAIRMPLPGRRWASQIGKKSKTACIPCRVSFFMRTVNLQHLEGKSVSQVAVLIIEYN